MADRAISGISIAEQNGPEHAIARASVAATAFIGRALKGPVNTPVSIASFGDYQRIFGGLWQPATLGYAIEQFFDNGGQHAIVVRIVNGGKPPTLTLAAGNGQLTLLGLCPGTREALRASVDYDGIGANETERFNLVLQRVQTAGSERVEDQEIFRRLSVRAGDERYVVDALTESRLARVLGEAPLQRPERSPAAPGGAVVGYVFANTDGDDGAALTDYDLIGSAQAHSGLFALHGAPPFGLLCIPPLTRDQDVGLSTLLVAARICRQRHAVLIIDPPATWDSPMQAFAGARQWPLRADNTAMFFPRVLAFDRLRGKFETFANSAAVAGMLARAETQRPVWQPGPEDDVPLRASLRPACHINESERARLLQLGVNTLSGVRLGLGGTAAAPRTLADGNAGSSDWRYLRMRRLALLVTASIEQGTRWTVFERNDASTWSKVVAQVSAFLDGLTKDGAFGDAAHSDPYFVICDARLNNAETRAAGKLRLLFGIASRPGEFHAWLLTQQAGASSLQQVSVNRLATAGRRVSNEIETALLRSLPSSA